MAVAIVFCLFVCLFFVCVLTFFLEKVRPFEASRHWQFQNMIDISTYRYLVFSFVASVSKEPFFSGEFVFGRTNHSRRKFSDDNGSINGVLRRPSRPSKRNQKVTNKNLKKKTTTTTTTKSRVTYGRRTEPWTPAKAKRKSEITKKNKKKQKNDASLRRRSFRVLPVRFPFFVLQGENSFFFFSGFRTCRNDVGFEFLFSANKKKRKLVYVTKGPSQLVASDWSVGVPAPSYWIARRRSNDPFSRKTR